MAAIKPVVKVRKMEVGREYLGMAAYREARRP